MLDSSFSQKVETWLSDGAPFVRVLDWLRDHSEAYVIGGTVRDLLLGRPIADLDVIVPSEAIKLGRMIASELGVAFYVLDGERDVCRVVLNTTTHIDIARFRERTLEADLLKRDFTVNALAWRIDSQPAQVIDVAAGLTDLLSGALRVVTDDSLVDDPLRMLRAVRFGSSLGFRIDAHTLDLIQRDAHLLASVSPERIRDEFLALLALDHPIQALEQLAALHLAEPVLGLSDKDLRRGIRSLSAVGKSMPILVADPVLAKAFVDDVRQVLAANRSRCLLDRLAILLWGAAGELGCRNICSRLMLSSREQRHVTLVAQGLQRLIEGPDDWWRAPESIYSFYDVLGRAGVDAAVLSGGLLPRAESFEAQTALLRAWYQQHASLVCPPRLVSGDRVRELTGATGPAIGQLLKSLALAQVRGEVTTIEQAEEWLLNH